MTTSCFDEHPEVYEEIHALLTRSYATLEVVIEVAARSGRCRPRAILLDDSEPTWDTPVLDRDENSAASDDRH
jgi:hypothetical protein